MNLTITSNPTELDRVFIETTVMYCIDRMNLSRLQELNITVECCELENEHGWVIEHIGNRDYTITLASNYATIRDFIETIIHEMAHIRQWIRNDVVLSEAETNADDWAEKLGNEMWGLSLI